MRNSNNSPTQKDNYFKVGEYLEAVRYSVIEPVLENLFIYLLSFI